MGEVLALGLGVPLADPVSVWPQTVVIEIAPELSAGVVAAAEGREFEVRAALAKLAAVTAEEMTDVTVTETSARTLLVCMQRDGTAARALSVAARRRATNAAEALHAAIAARA